MKPSQPTPERSKPTYPKLFWPALLIGWAFIANGIRGLLDHQASVRLSGFGRVFVGAALIHDLLVAPFVIGLGVIVARVVPPVIRPAVQAGLIVSGTVVLFAFPFVRGYGRIANNPSILPRNYAQGLAIVLVLVWTAVILSASVAWRRSVRRGPN